MVSASYAIAAVVVDDLVATVACACYHPKVLDVVATVLLPNASDWDARDACVAAAAHMPRVSPARVNPCLDTRMLQLLPWPAPPPDCWACNLWFSNESAALKR